jgi:hypothetical protein
MAVTSSKVVNQADKQRNNRNAAAHRNFLKFEQLFERQDVTSSEQFGTQLGYAQALAKLSDFNSQAKAENLFRGLEKILKIHLDNDTLHEIRTQLVVDYFRSHARYYRLQKNYDRCSQQLEKFKIFLSNLEKDEVAGIIAPLWNLILAEEYFKLGRDINNDRSKSIESDILGIEITRESQRLFLKCLKSFDNNDFDTAYPAEKKFLALTRLSDISDSLGDKISKFEFASEALTLQFPSHYAVYKAVGHHKTRLLLDCFDSELNTYLAAKNHSNSEDLTEIRESALSNISFLIREVKTLLNYLSSFGLLTDKSLEVLKGVLSFQQTCSLSSPKESMGKNEIYRGRKKFAYENIDQEFLGQLFQLKTTLLEQSDKSSLAFKVGSILSKLTIFLADNSNESVADPALELASWYVKINQPLQPS